MKSVGIKALKDKLSAYLKLVRAGEIVLVTDRDEVIAEIRRPSSIASSSKSRFEQYLEEASRSGSVSMRVGVQTLISQKPFPVSSADLLPPPIPISVQELLDQTRSDRY